VGRIFTTVLMAKYENEYEWYGRTRRPLHRNHFVIYCAFPSIISYSWE